MSEQNPPQEGPTETTPPEPEVPQPATQPEPPGSPAAGHTPAAAPQGPPPPRRLVRLEEDKVIAGVCSGLGAYTGVDPVVWRIGFVVLALVGVGTGIIAYLVAWLVMPRAPEGSPPPTPHYRSSSHGSGGAMGGRGQASMWLGVGLVILGAWVLFSGFWQPRSGIFWGLLLIAVGAVLWARELGSSGSGTREDGTPPPGSGLTPPQEGDDPSLQTTRHSAAPPAAPPPRTPSQPTETSFPVPPPPPPPAPTASTPGPGSRQDAPSRRPLRREPSILGRLVVGAAALAIGIGVLMDNLGVLRLTPTGILAVLLAIVGVGLVVGSYWGRARWLAIPGVLLALTLVVVSLIPFHLEGGWGQVAWQPTRAGDIEPVYRHAAGEAVLDLSQVAIGERRRDIDVRVGFGQLLVVVPDEADVVVSARVQGGEASLFGRRISGWDVSTRVVDRGTGEGPLYIDASVTFGEIFVQRVSDGRLPARGRSSRSSGRLLDGALETLGADFAPDPGGRL